MYFCDTRLERTLLRYIAEDILELIDVKSLKNAENVSQTWRETIVTGKLWEKLYRKQVYIVHYWLNSIYFLIYCFQLASKSEWKKMAENLFLRGFFSEKPESVDNPAILQDLHSWYRKLCLFVHKTIQVTHNHHSSVIIKCLLMFNAY